MRFASVAGVVALGLPLLAGCGDESRFFIVQNQVPGAGCVISAEQTEAYIGKGRVDVSLVGDEQPVAYSVYALLRNDLPAVGESGAPEPNRMTIKGFRVAVRLGDSPPAAAKQVFEALAADETGRRFLDYDLPWAGTIEPGGGSLSAGVGAIPGEVARRLRQADVFANAPRVNLMVTIKAIGERPSGDLESTPFRFPIEACEGCLVAFQGTCPIAKREHAGHVCNIAQDRLVDCCLDGGIPRCPAPVQQTMASPSP